MDMRIGIIPVPIYVVLCALLFVAITQANVRAQRLQCVSSLIQHGKALNGFVGDQGKYPLFINPGVQFGLFPDHARSVTEALSTHGLGAPPQNPRDKSSVYLCPRAIRQYESDKHLNDFVALYGYNAYGLDGWLAGSLGLGGSYDDQSQSFAPVVESQVAAPSRMLAMGDGISGWDRAYQDSSILARSSRTQDGSGSTERVMKRHDGRLNVLFCDGHVKSVTLRFLFSDTDDESLNAWNLDNQPHRERIK